MQRLCLVTFVATLFVVNLNFTSQVMAQDGLVGYWTLDDGTGTVAADSSSSGHDGTFEGDPEWSAQGMMGGALDFDGDGDFIQTTLLDELQTADGVTISAWFKTNVTDTGQQHLIWIGDVAGNGWGAQSELHLSINHFNFSNKLVFYFGSGTDTDGQSINMVSLEDFTDTGNWRHITGVIENANGPTVTGTLYLDGQVVEPFVDGFQTADGIPFPTTDSTSLVPERTTWNTPLRIGAPGTASRYFNGSLDDVRVYNRALTPAEIAQTTTPVEPQGKLTTVWGRVKAAR